MAKKLKSRSIYFNYLITCIIIVVVSCSAICFAFLHTTMESLQNLNDESIYGKIDIVLDDLQLQTEQLYKIAVEVEWNPIFSPDKINLNISNKYEMLDTLEDFSNNAVLFDDFFIYYKDCETIYNSTSTTSYFTQYIQNVLYYENSEELKAEIESVNSLQLVQLGDSDNFLFVYPVRINSSSVATNAYICFNISKNDILDRIVVTTGSFNSDILVYYDETLIYGSEELLENEYLYGQLYNSHFSIYVDNSLEYFSGVGFIYNFRNLIIILIIFVVMIALAVAFSKKLYKPIKNLMQNKDIIENLNLSGLNNEKTNTKNELQILNNVFSEVHQHIIDQRSTLKRRLLTLIINGDFSIEIQEQLLQLGVILNKDYKYGVLCIETQSDLDSKLFNKEIPIIEKTSTLDCQIYIVSAQENKKIIFVATKFEETFQAKMQILDKYYKDNDVDVVLKAGSFYEDLPSVQNSYLEATDGNFIDTIGESNEQTIQKIADLIRINKLNSAVDLLFVEYNIDENREINIPLKRYVCADITIAAIRICSLFDAKLDRRDASILLCTNDVKNIRKKILEVFKKCMTNKGASIDMDVLVEALPYNDKMSKRMQDIVLYINQHYQEYDMCLDLICEEYKIHHNTLSSIFKKEMGKNYKDYLTELRISLAKQLLENEPDLSVADVSNAVGYRNISYFIKCFKEQVGTTPNAYRKDISK